LRALEGAEAWTVDLVDSTEASVIYDPLPADIDEDGITDIVYGVHDKESLITRINVLDGSDGSKLWVDDYQDTVSSHQYPLSLGDVTGDGVVDLAVVMATLRLIDGTDGTEIDRYDVQTGYDLPMFVDPDEDGEPEILLHGGYYAPRLLDADMTELWLAPDDRYKGGHGAVFECPEGDKVVVSKYNSSILRRFDLLTGTLDEELSFASGAGWPDEDAAVAAGARPGYLSPVTGHTDTTGSGAPGAAFGSSDGWLYLVDACTFEVVEAEALGHPVGEPVFVDVDEDGLDEILVMVQDGFLYALDAEPFTAPAWVRENDGSGPALSALDDVDELETWDTLWANWDGVDGATFYEYSVITSGEVPVTDPVWVDADDSLEAEVSGLPLVLGGRYFFAVRATGDTGVSPEGLSDGVRIVDLTPPIVEITADPVTFFASSGGDGESTHLEARMSDATSLVGYQVKITNSGGNEVVAVGPVSVTGPSADWQMEWNGTEDDGSLVEEGTYTVTITAWDGGDHLVEDRVDVTVNGGGGGGDLEWRARGGACGCVRVY
jgi:hypothetical protein